MKFNFESEVVLENDRALLRPMQPADAPLLIDAALSDPNLLQFSPTPINSEERLGNYVANALRDREKRIRYPFVIFDKTTQTFAGSSSFGNVANHDKRLEIGWTWYGKMHQRSGLNRHCKLLLMTYVFETLEFERLEFKTDERNMASRMAIEKIGGKFEGILRSHMTMNDGFRRNSVYYSILRNEWPEVKEKVMASMRELK